MTTLVTPRDMEIFAALERSPLTVRQLLAVSQVFVEPFTSERCVRERLGLLCAAGRVRRWFYATAGRGALGYYVLSRTGFHLLHGPEAVPAKRIGSAVSLARQPHTQALAEFIVHTMVAAHHAGLRLQSFAAENTLCLNQDQECLYPDCAFQLSVPDGRLFSSYVELDNGTQPVHSAKDLECWHRKIRFYERFQDQSQERFRVLLVSTRSGQRLDHLLQTAASLARIPARSLCYGITLSEYLRAPYPLTENCFRNHRDQRATLVPMTRVATSTWRPVVSPPSSDMVISSSCR